MSSSRSNCASWTGQFRRHGKGQFIFIDVVAAIHGCQVSDVLLKARSWQSQTAQFGQL
jgi:hypothetical protein